jgi:hypothetical protein
MIGTEALGWGRCQERITIWPQLVTGTLNKDVVRLLSLLLWRGRNINTATIRKIADSRVSTPPCSGALPLLSLSLCLMTHPVFLSVLECSITGWGLPYRRRWLRVIMLLPVAGARRDPGQSILLQRDEQ